MPGASITCRGWGWRHAGRGDWALRDVDLTIEPGERVLLLGASGAGKSTLLHALAGLTGDDASLSGDEEGTLTVGGRPAHDARGRVGLVAQDPQTQLVMARSGDDVAFGLENRAVPRAGIWPRVRTALRDVGFAYGADHPTARLSGGEQQRLVIAGVLALRPDLLLLDEPTANLDPPGAALVRDVLAGLAGDPGFGATMLLVEHRVADLVDLVDRVVVLEPGGGVVADGTPGEVFARQGADLAARGVWVPGHEPAPRIPAACPGTELIAARDCGVRAVDPLGAPPAADPLAGADADLVEGTVTALTGHNGAGKSTLLMLLAGLDRPDRGTVSPRGRLARVNTRPLHRWPARHLADHLGTVFQRAESQFVTANVRAELRFGPLRTGGAEPDVDRRTDELLDRLRLAHLAQAHPFTLSGGEKRRLSVATALATAPDVLLLDEPTFGQDARTWAELVDLLAELRADGRAIGLATHDTRLLGALADRTIAMANGRVVSPDPARVPR